MWNIFNAKNRHQNDVTVAFFIEASDLTWTTDQMTEIYVEHNNDVGLVYLLLTLNISHTF